MIQALGMLKLFKDINENNVVKDFVFTQFKSIEEADDKGIFYIKTIADSKEDKFIKKELYNYICNKKPFKLVCSLLKKNKYWL